MLKLLKKIVYFYLKNPSKRILYSGFLLLLILLMPGIFYFADLKANAQENPNIDAIAVRVLANEDNYSASRWYREQGFTGSPQSLIVDGYEAIRDNRTVLVNAANVSGSTFFTNIYLISYNLDAERETQDIFSKILSNWKFNTNLTEPGNCDKSIQVNCLLDSECPLGEFCLSAKAKVTRDTRRLADLADIRTELKAYAQSRGYYPKLESGSYLRGWSISTWPSWRDKFSSDLGYKLPFDPVNRLGPCPAYNEITCWDEYNTKFASNLPNLPSDSRVYAYSVAADYASFEACAVMESGYAISGNCSQGAAGNRQPQIINSNFPDACQGEPYNAYIEAYDADSDPLSWSFSGSWGAVMEDIPGFLNKKRIYAASAGSIGTGNFQISVSDGRGGSAVGNYTVNSIDCTPSCVPSCSTGPGCRTSLANGQVAAGECCGSGSCYNCLSGYSWNGTSCQLNCVPNCSTGPGCRTSLANGQVVAGECCGSGSCYNCLSGYSWNGTSCQLNCVVNCTSPFGGCLGSQPVNTKELDGSNCCGSGTCYVCADGYSWNGTSCQLDCVVNCTSPFGGCLASQPVNTKESDGSNCCGSGTCYVCADGYHYSSGACVPDCVVNCTSPFGGCLATQPSNTKELAGSNCCGSGTCYVCADGYEWNGSSCELIPTCGVYFQGVMIGSPTEMPFYEPFTPSIYSDWVTGGSYGSNQFAFPKAIEYSLDGIAVDVNTRLEMWDGPNYSGTKVLDVVGPVVINSSEWISKGYYVFPYTLENYFGLNPAVWPDCRFSTEFMDPWGDNGSCKITCL